MSGSESAPDVRGPAQMIATAQGELTPLVSLFSTPIAAPGVMARGCGSPFSALRMVVTLMPTDVPLETDQSSELP